MTQEPENRPDETTGSAPEGVPAREASSPAPPEPLLGEPASSDPILEQHSDSGSILGEPSEQSSQVVVAEQRVQSVEAPEVAADAATPSGAAEPRSLSDMVVAFRSGDKAAAAAALEKAARLLLSFALFLVPVVLDPRTIDSFNLAKLTSLWVLGILSIGAWWYATHLSGHTRSLPRSRIVRLSLILLGITTLATILSTNRVLSLIGLYHRYEGLISLAIYIGVVIAIVLLYRDRPDALSEIATALAAACGVVALYVILQKLGIDVSQWRQATGTAPRFPIGSLGNSSFTASFLGIAAPFVLYRVVAAPNIARRFVWVVAGVMTAISLWLTAGRAGMLAAAAGVLALLLFTSRIRPGRKLAVIALTLAALVVIPIAFGDPTDPEQRAVARTGTAGYRVQIWDASWHMYLNRPIVGWGPESFYGNYPRFRTPDEARKQGLAISDKPHNIYLGWATATGTAGAVAYLLLVGGALVLVARRVPTLRGSRRLLAATFGAGLVGYLVQGVYSIDVPPLALMNWVTLAGIAVLLERSGENDVTSAEGAELTEGNSVPTERPATKVAGMLRNPDAAWNRRPWIVPTAVGVLVLFLIVIGLGPLRADHVAWAAQRRGKTWSSDTMEMYEKAISLNKREAAYRGLAGAYLEGVAGDPQAPFDEESGLRRSAALYRQALELQPRNVYFMINLARVYARLGGEFDVGYFAEGERYIGRAVTLDTLNPQMHDLYADLLNKWQAELKGRDRRVTLQRARTQAGIAQALREGKVLR